MPKGYSAETVGVLDGTLLPAAKADGRVYGARARVYQATFDMAAANVETADGDTNVCFKLPAGEKPFLGALLASATMGAVATIAVGTAASPGKYRAAATFETANVPTLFMLSAAADDDPLEDEEEVIITIAGAALPAAGILQVFMLTSGR